MPDDDSGVAAKRLDILKRIAETLDMPAGTLSGPAEAAERPASTLRDEVRAMLAAFVRIRDPEQRRACLGYVTDIVNGQAGAADGSDRDGP